MATYKTPGVYVEEICDAAAIGRRGGDRGSGVHRLHRNRPARHRRPGRRARCDDARVQDRVRRTAAASGSRSPSPPIRRPRRRWRWWPPAAAFSLYYALSLYFSNGGGPCYVVSVGGYDASPSKARFLAGLTALEKEDEPTLIVLTDAAGVLSPTDYYVVCGQALLQCQALGDRFTIIDVPKGDWKGFRNDANLSANLMYGAAYHPYLQTSISYDYNDADVSITRAAVRRQRHRHAQSGRRQRHQHQLHRSGHEHAQRGRDVRRQGRGAGLFAFRPAP